MNELNALTGSFRRTVSTRLALRPWSRVVSLLAVGLASGSPILHAPHANAASAATSASQRPLYESGQLGVKGDDVQRLLTEATGVPDAEVARRLSALVLTERMSDATLQSLEKNAPGLESRSALRALADASAFLAPAPADVLPQAPPGLSEQRRMVALTVEYLRDTLPRLPDFYATRTTIRYDGDPQTVKRRGQIQAEDSSWREVDRAQGIVQFRDGKEVVDPQGDAKHTAHPPARGLITRGTFGPILSTVIVDAAHGSTTWARWERGSGGTLAVFRYRVPDQQSHYAVAFPCRSSDMGENATGYHGEVAIDPETGAILRLTVQADPPLGSSILQADIMVAYAPVDIGGKLYTCPVRSVSISLDDAGLSGGLVPLGRRAAQVANATLLNDVTFADYHLFRSDSRILSGDVPLPQP